MAICFFWVELCGETLNERSRASLLRRFSMTPAPPTLARGRPRPFPRLPQISATGSLVSARTRVEQLPLGFGQCAQQHLSLQVLTRESPGTDEPFPRHSCMMTPHSIGRPTGTFWLPPRRPQERLAERGLDTTKCHAAILPTFLHLAQTKQSCAKARSDDLLFTICRITSPNFKSRARTSLMERVAESQ